jgi:O-methyltransferase
MTKPTPPSPSLWEFIAAMGNQFSALGHERLAILTQAVDSTLNLQGEIWDCGTGEGGSALWMKSRLLRGNSSKMLRVFDTFAGLPFSGVNDIHPVGVMASDYDRVASRFLGLSNYQIIKGVMPDTFAGLENSVISVAHIDVDQYDSVRLCLEFVYPRVVSGGWIIFDDYNCGACPGAKKAVDEFLVGKPERLIAPGRENPQARFIKV